MHRLWKKVDVKYTFTLTEVGWEREKIILESGSGESTRHIALKVLAYLLFRHEIESLPLQIERRVGQRHKPDLVAQDPERGAIQLWVDCGQIETERLGRIARRNPQARIVIVKPTETEARLYAIAARKDLPEEPERRALIRFVGFAPDFLVGFLQPLRGTNDLAFLREVTTDRTEETVRVTLNGEAFTTKIFVQSSENL